MITSQKQYQRRGINYFGIIYSNESEQSTHKKKFTVHVIENWFLDNLKGGDGKLALTRLTVP